MVRALDISGTVLYMPLVLLSFICVSFLAAPSVVADDNTVIDKVNVKVSTSCTISGIGTNTHYAEIYNGTYEDDIGTTVLSAFCNDNEGFAIYATGYTGNTIGEENSNKLVGTTQGAGNIVTGTATSAGNPDVSNWAMKLAITQDSGDTTGTNAFAIDSDTEGPFSVYHTVPNNFTKVAHKNSLSNMNITTGGVKLTTTYAVYMAKNQPAGMYSGKVKYTLVHPATAVPNEPKSCSNNTICYWPNGNGFVTDTMGDQTYAKGTSGTRVGPSVEVTLWPTNFKRQGYGFVGWTDKYDWVLNENDADGNGTGANAGYHIYGPMQDITTPSDMSSGLSLYAVWVPSAGYIQNWTCPNNTIMPIGTVTALTDKRDNDTYAVAKLADSNCWMIENLRLDYDAEHNTDGSLAQGYGTSATYGNFIGLAEPETANFSNSTTANSLYKSDGSGDIKGINGATLTDIGTTNSPGYRFPRYNNNNTNPTATAANPNTTVADMTGPSDSGSYKANIYSYGNYYTWAAAIADTTYYTNNQSVTNTSICPAGWRLPQGGNKTRIESNDDNDFWNLIVDGLNNGTLPNNYSSSTTPYYTGADEAGPVAKLARSFPNNLLYSGYFNTASTTNRGSVGFYWSSTASSYNRSYHLYLGSSNVYPGNYNLNKNYGFSARCMVGS